MIYNKGIKMDFVTDEVKRRLMKGDLYKGPTYGLSKDNLYDDVTDIILLAIGSSNDGEVHYDPVRDSSYYGRMYCEQYEIPWKYIKKPLRVVYDFLNKLKWIITEDNIK